MIKDTLYTGSEVQEKLIASIRKCAEAVGCTMGTSGSNVIVEAIESPGHMVTNDGATILDHIYFEDPIENIGKNILMEAVRRANKQSGDGSSTTTILTHAILEEGMKIEGASKMDIKRSLEECIPEIETIIQSLKRDITVDEVAAVASIAAEDAEIGNLIQEIYTKIGKDGIIYWDISKTTEDSYVIGNGITIADAGFYSPYMCDITKEGQTTNQINLKNPTILITKQKIIKAQEFNAIAAQLHGKGINDLVIFCNEIDPLVVPDVLKTRIEKGFRIVLVKMPTLWKDEWYEDIAKTSGATIIDPAGGLFIKDVSLKHLGLFGNVIITKDEVYIDGIKDISNHLEELKQQGTDDATNRIARLNTKTARLYLGAHSESALSYKRLKVEDAISAAYHALQNGIVAGGGTTLIAVSQSISIGLGGKILCEALKYPAKQIAKNSGYDTIDIGNDYTYPFGFDSKTKSFVNMFDVGIVDPANIVLNACKNAISVAASILTTNAITVLPREEK